MDCATSPRMKRNVIRSHAITNRGEELDNKSGMHAQVHCYISLAIQRRYVFATLYLIVYGYTKVFMRSIWWALLTVREDLYPFCVHIKYIRLLPILVHPYHQYSSSDMDCLYLVRGIMFPSLSCRCHPLYEQNIEGGSILWHYKNPYMVLRRYRNRR